MKTLRATYRALTFFFGGLWMMMRIGFMNLVKGKDMARTLRYKQHFLRWLIPAMGVRITYYGEAPREAGLIMSNHRSYYDPMPVLRQCWGLPVSKASVRKWPIIGLGAHMAGTVFVDRTTPETRQAARDEINMHLADGFSILIYPEGTIHLGPELGPLKMGMFRDAAEHGYPIHPVAKEYRYAADAWHGGPGFAAHFFDRFGEKEVEMKLSFGPPITGDDPQELHDRFKAWVEAEIVRLREGWYRS